MPSLEPRFSICETPTFVIIAQSERYINAEVENPVVWIGVGPVSGAAFGVNVILLEFREQGQKVVTAQEDFER